MYNPYQQYQPYQQQMFQQSQMIPQQQIIQVNGKASVDTIHLAPNSSILVLDTTAPIVWSCISDGVGRVTATPYDIKPHEEQQQPGVEDIEKRLESLEAAVIKMEEKFNAKSDVGRTKSKQSLANDTTD